MFTKNVIKEVLQVNEICIVLNKIYIYSITFYDLQLLLPNKHKKNIKSKIEKAINSLLQLKLFNPQTLVPLHTWTKYYALLSKSAATI